VQVTVLALDLEGTLVSTAVSGFARPGLARFLTWAQSRSRECSSRGVPGARARAVAVALVELGEAPGWYRDIEIVEAAGSVKDLLRLVPSLDEALLVEDRQASSAPGQAHRLVRVPGWEYPYPRGRPGPAGSPGAQLPAQRGQAATATRPRTPTGRARQHSQRGGVMTRGGRCWLRNSS